MRKLKPSHLVTYPETTFCYRPRPERPLFLPISLLFRPFFAIFGLPNGVIAIDAITPAPFCVFRIVERTERCCTVWPMAGVQSIERAFLLLRELTRQPMGVTELAEVADLPKSTVARLLSALGTEGAVEQTEAGGVYQLGPLLAELGAGRGEPRLADISAPFLAELTEATNESSGLDTLRDGWVHFIDHVAAHRDVQVRDWTGESGRAHSVPSGLAILAHSGEATVDAYIAGGLDALTAQTMCDGETLRARLIQVRSAGYAWCFEEFTEGINSVAAPVFDNDGVVAAVRVHGPTYRFPNPDHAHDLGVLVAGVAQRLTDVLQHG